MVFVIQCVVQGCIPVLEPFRFAALAEDGYEGSFDHLLNALQVGEEGGVEPSFVVFVFGGECFFAIVFGEVLAHEDCEASRFICDVYVELDRHK